jgi:sugar-specific transcriptional regulator TrmB
MTLLPLREKNVMVLMELGLTASEAKTYLGLIATGKSRIGALAKTTGIHREHLYQTMRSLVNKGLVQKELGRICKYKAISLDETLPMLVRHKRTQMSRMEAEAQVIIDDFKNNQPSNLEISGLEDENSQFVVVPGREVIVQRLKQSLQKAQFSVDTITTEKRFSAAVLEFAKDYQKAIDRGVKIRIATEKHVIEKTAMETLQTLTKNPNFCIKNFSDPPQAVVAIFDNKEAIVTLSAKAHLAGADGLWSNNSCFVTLAQTYFENKWNNAQ